MSQVKRYDVGEYGSGMIEMEDGAWYHEDDYAELKADRDALLEALELADAALSGANMDMKVVERKVKTAIAESRGDV